MLCLMIVAHPDDETIFGGQELLSGDDWHVICLTNGDNVRRQKDFRKAMELAGASFEIWNYPDRPGWSCKPDEARAAWVPLLEEICSRIRKRLEARPFDRVVTHNQEGEYGHIQHQMVHDLVLQVIGTAVLQVFCIGDVDIQPDILERKMVLLDAYGDQISYKERIKWQPWIIRATTRYLK